MDLKTSYDLDSIQELVDKLVLSKIITSKEAKAIDTKKLVEFSKTDFAMRISKAQKVFKERPFYININANKLIDEEVSENVLVQGIIDLYFIDEDGKIVLVDYKTDFIKTEIELVDKYKKQLEIYKNALEQALDKKVDEVYIYSVFLNKEIRI